MEISPIKSQRDYRNTLKEIEGVLTHALEKEAGGRGVLPRA